MLERYFLIFKHNGYCPGSQLNCSISCGPELSEFCFSFKRGEYSILCKERKNFIVSKLMAAGYEERIFEELL